MRAAVVDGYGGVDRLHVRDVAEPEPPGTGQVLVRVRATSVNPLDWKIRNGSLRFVLPARFPLIPGFDLAGEVAAVGPEVTRFEPGDPVFGQTGARLGGACAELALASELTLASIPEGVSMEDAAALPMAGLTALQALRDQGELADGESVLINGAAGGVGHFALQIARILGARTAGVASGQGGGLVRGLGAGRVFNYQVEDFTADDSTYEVVFDAAGTSSYERCAPLLAENGIFVTTEAGPRTFFDVLATRFRGLAGEDRRARFVRVKANVADLELLGNWTRLGRLRPVIQAILPLEEIRQAHQASETGHANGKTVLRVA